MAVTAQAPGTVSNVLKMPARSTEFEYAIPTGRINSVGNISGTATQSVLGVEARLRRTVRLVLVGQNSQVVFVSVSRITLEAIVQLISEYAFAM
jgi:hypothetical protein